MNYPIMMVSIGSKKFFLRTNSWQEVFNAERKAERFFGFNFFYNYNHNIVITDHKIAVADDFSLFSVDARFLDALEKIGYNIPLDNVFNNIFTESDEDCYSMELSFYERIIKMVVDIIQYFSDCSFELLSEDDVKNYNIHHYDYYRIASFSLIKGEF